MTQAPAGEILRSSFRDPSGFLCRLNGTLYRQVNLRGKDSYEQLMRSGLYQKLVGEKALLPHREVPLKAVAGAEAVSAYKFIEPEPIPFISYPYEWCFSELKEAALLTLKVQRTALEFGMTLKDASAYNVQFQGARPIFMDTLSFETALERQPWIAYQQFCQHFLAPLALMSRTDGRLHRLSALYLDGIPLDLASRLLPMRSRLSWPLLLHLHLHAVAQRRFADRPIRQESTQVNRWALLGLTDQLESAVRSLEWRPTHSPWKNYYDTELSPQVLAEKERGVLRLLDRVRPAAGSVVWDLGANTGHFSRLIAAQKVFTLSWDMDPVCVEANYQRCLEQQEERLLPLILDLTNPSPSLGWEHQERSSLLERGPADGVLALALVHHLAFSNQLPLGRIAGLFSRICRWGIVEFVPKSDPQAQRLLRLRENLFPGYTREKFEEAFQAFFTLHPPLPLPGTQRLLYLMEKKP